ncbi:1,2-phenylacetyl-CoA epoxidase subunit PaaC [Sediminibacterium soli]|uniref:1,2-phenylacetyl-CoA epoxidase subunit PaaC n=1 Tax=Sediminibacterium soli TaxID=2698829 RepID=UPI0013795377|nr:1,2-phenylacetyl-CoA epoxidase subunit PaaC [Sediminibacterium soli]NCI45329.1 phenylacetate-CoA oxygenase subunit PaaC [Sediminibacterium soli]
MADQITDTTKSRLIHYATHLGDNALILGHRNSEWCGHGPVLEQDIAISNIALDLLGQARNFYQYAAELTGNGATEDTLAYLRDVPDFKNTLIAELPNGDWAQTVLRQFFFSAYQYYLYRQLQKSGDAQLAAIAEKAWKEVSYHLRWSSEWVIRLGDGTEESHERMNRALDLLWTYTGDMFIPEAYETEVFAVDPARVKADWEQKIKQVLEEATLTVPENTWTQSGGKKGIHSEHLGYILAEMQFLQRAYPGAAW